MWDENFPGKLQITLSELCHKVEVKLFFGKYLTCDYQKRGQKIKTPRSI